MSLSARSLPGASRQELPLAARFPETLITPDYVIVRYEWTSRYAEIGTRFSLIEDRGPREVAIARYGLNRGPDISEGLLDRHMEIQTAVKVVSDFYISLSSRFPVYRSAG